MKTSDCYYLVTIDSKGQVRQVAGEYHWEDNHYIINRYSGLYKGKITKHPEILIERGKAGRGVLEQCILQFKHIIKEYCDKGYKVLTKPANQYELDELKSITGASKTNKEGLLKPMLAKQADDVANKKVFDKRYYASRKINGVRCLMYWDADKEEIRTASRGAINYNLVTWLIRNNEKFIDWFSKHQNYIIDGEIYKFGLPLNYISGICRSQKTAQDGDEFELYVYDLIDCENLDLTFDERLKLIQRFAEDLSLEFNPERIWEEDELKIQIVPQIEISGFNNMMELHNKYVSEGWEGLVVRLATAKYGPGKRTNDMIKIKVYKDFTCKCIGIEQGLRPYDDMVFIMEMEDGKTFKAKPYGTHEVKVEYTENFEEKYLNQYGDVKYFEISPYGIPEQPVFLAFRAE